MRTRAGKSESRENMKVREELLELFEANKGRYFSGEELAGRLCVSRAAVWKAVKTLREEGYVIDAVTNKGYCLSTKTDILSPQGIRKYLSPECGGLEIEVLSAVDSTNGLVRRKADSGRAEGCVVVANEQTDGRGRRGRLFFSPAETGIYMSILLRPCHYSAGQAVRFTTMAAVAICEAIEEVSTEKAGIKWVNDIYVGGKKVCGILTEASFDLESGLVEYAVLGVGINVYRPRGGFPKGLEQTAGFLFENTRDDLKNRLTAAFLNHFLEYYRAESLTGYIEKYRQRSLVVGKEVTVIDGDRTRTAFAYGVDDDCRLLVRYDDGLTEGLSYGEIGIRL